MAQQPNIYRFFVAATAGGASIGRNYYLPIVPLTLNSGNYNGAIAADPPMLIGPSRFPSMSVNFFSASPILLSCTIIGDLLPIA
jgi:hypothetical protein